MPENIAKSPASYRVVSRDAGDYGVEVSIEGSSPTMVTSFPTEEAANDWIDAHKNRSTEVKPRYWRARR
jgi:hypothetical protein